MHTITLKSDDNFYDMLENMVAQLNITKSELIRRSVTHYKTLMEKEKLKEQIKNASYKTREDSLRITTAFEKTLDDGLDV